MWSSPRIGALYPSAICIKYGTKHFRSGAGINSLPSRPVSLVFVMSSRLFPFLFVVVVVEGLLLSIHLISFLLKSLLRHDFVFLLCRRSPRGTTSVSHCNNCAAHAHSTHRVVRCRLT